MNSLGNIVNIIIHKHNIRKKLGKILILLRVHFKQHSENYFKANVFLQLCTDHSTVIEELYQNITNENAEILEAVNTISTIILLNNTALMTPQLGLI